MGKPFNAVPLPQKLAQGLKYLRPVEVGKEFSESPDKVINAPLNCIFLVDNILLEKRAI
jgi:hypothetical protein